MKKLKMSPNRTKGYLITFCGLDGSGKTTIINKILSDLQTKNNIFLTKQPTDFVRKSEIFRTFMDSPVNDAFDYRSLSLLAASDRIQHTNKTIKPALEKGEIVLSDRYFYSCLANLNARGFSGDKWIYEISKSIIKPDAAFFFDVPVDIAVKRVRQRPEEKDRYIDIDLQQKLREQYLKICKANNGILISTEQSEAECYKTVKTILERIMRNGNTKQNN